jgi:hypothetical protein
MYTVAYDSNTEICMSVWYGVVSPRPGAQTGCCHLSVINFLCPIQPVEKAGRTR